MKILCFGDSNTYGYCAKGGRIEENYPRLPNVAVKPLALATGI